MIWIRPNGELIDLNGDSEPDHEFRRRAREVGEGLFAATGSVALTWARDDAGVPGDFAWNARVLCVVLFLCGTLAVYLSNVPSGNVAAIRGMVVGGLAMALWLGWRCAQTTPRMGPVFVLDGSMAGLVAGGLLGVIAGVFLGWVESTIFGSRTEWRDSAAEEPRDSASGYVRDPWLDEL